MIIEDPNAPVVRKLAANYAKRLPGVKVFDFTWKAQKLQEIIELCIDKDKYGQAIAAICELNKMHGHHAATKMVTINADIDTHLETVNRVLEELKPAYKREF